MCTYTTISSHTDHFEIQKRDSEESLLTFVNLFPTSVILLINQSKEIGEKQFSVFGSRGGQNSPLMHVPLCNDYKIEK